MFPDSFSSFQSTVALQPRLGSGTLARMRPPQWIAIRFLLVAAGHIAGAWEGFGDGAAQVQLAIRTVKIAKQYNANAAHESEARKFSKFANLAERGNRQRRKCEVGHGIDLRTGNRGASDAVGNRERKRRKEKQGWGKPEWATAAESAEER